jgi:hypothetical protein
MAASSSLRLARALLLWLVPFALAACLACSSSGGNAVQGQVTYNGNPIQGAVVVFHPEGGDWKSVRPTGVTGEDGTFTLTTGKAAGAPAGEYRVTVIWPAEPVEGKSKMMSTEPAPPPPDRLDGRYADAKTTSLRATVKSGRNTLDPFELK